MNPRTRLLIAFACMVAFLLAQGVVATVVQGRLIREVKVLNQAHDETHQVLFLLHQAQTDASLVVGTQNPQAMDRYRDRHQRAMATLLDRATQQGLDLVPLERLRTAYGEVIDLQYQFAFQMARTRLASTASEYEQAVALANERLQLVRQAKAQALEARSSAARQLILGLALLALGTALAWALHLAKVLTDRRRAEESVAQTLAQLQSVLDAATQVSIIMTDPQGTIRLFNRGAERLLGYRAEEVVGLTTPMIFHDPEEVARLREAIPSGGDLDDFTVETYAPRHGQVTRRHETYVTKTGQRRTVDLAITEVRGPEGAITGFLGVALDITQQLETEAALRDQEDQLRQAQKMDAIGQLAGGVAHDFNNMLSGILGSVELIQELTQPGDQRKELAALAIRASHRAADLTAKLLAFSRKGRLRSEPVDLNRIVEETRDLLTRSIDRRIQLDVSLMAFHPWTTGDPSQLQNALLNIAINARDAMPEGGRLALATEDAVLGEEARRDGRFPVQPGPFVCVRVTDTGMGIPEAHLERIFEPFFTTKPQGQGTGLGLAAVYGIVKDHGGMVTVSSVPGEGTTFRLYFPVSEPPRESATGAAPVAPTARRGRVLLVDDEDVLRETVARMLASLGFDVLQGADGQEGVDLYAAHLGRVDLVILDMMMPRLSGAQAFERIRAMDPSARVILASGYSRDASVSALLDQGLKAFLHKPFLKKDLVEAIEQAMGE